jgi:dienelactone hydrolase
MSDETPLSIRHPAEAAIGGVVVVQEAFGLTEHIEDVCQRFADAGWLAPTEVVRYPDARHGFHRDGSAAYHADSSEDAWHRTLDWFARFLTTGAADVV